ncbi:MAG: Stp1/IreP family PP2C-type Ser/Thr phosphatase [Actinobacteria bacterium]|nr:Stp1/IreP family PP2C-type Ser/Thr phosphatase [Actinomycetota bacterium]
MRYAALSETGKVRVRNEDSYCADGHVFIVADGMGGHRAGEVASATAIEEFVRFEENNGEIPPLERIRGGIQAANLALMRMAGDDPELEGMGTTFTMVLVEGDLYLGHVGDSRAYIWRKGALRPLTRDHSLVQRMVSEGYISPGEARVHPQRNIILRALGVSGELEVDLDIVDTAPGDRLLLCSDGLSGFVEDAELEAIVSLASEPEECCRRLVDAALERGGIDNITVIVIDLEDESERGGGAGPVAKRTWWRKLSGRVEEDRM